MEKSIIGYTIKVSRYKENDAIITLLTKDGLETFKAKSICKQNNKNAYLVSLYTKSELKLTYKKEGGNETLIGGSLLSFIKEVYDNLNYSILFGILSEIALRYNGIEFYETFDYIATNINRIDVYSAIIYALRYLLDKEGVLPVGNECVICQSKTNIEYLSFIDGGFICHSCNLYNKTTDIKLLKTYHLIYMMDLKNLIKVVIEKDTALYFIKLMFDYIETSTGILLNSSKVFRDLL